MLQIILHPFLDSGILISHMGKKKKKRVRKLQISTGTAICNLFLCLTPCPVHLKAFKGYQVARRSLRWERNHSLISSIPYCIWKTGFFFFFCQREKARTKENIISTLYAMWGITNMWLQHHFYIPTMHYC